MYSMASWRTEAVSVWVKTDENKLLLMKSKVFLFPLYNLEKIKI